MQKLLLIALLIMGFVNSTEPTDCAGVAGGTAATDACGVCDTDTTNDCVPDCIAGDGTDGFELWNECYSIKETTEINIFFVGLTGGIPPEIGNLVNLTKLHLAANQITGEIPPEICNIGDSSPSLYNNKLCPPYPDCGEGEITSEEQQDTSECPE